MEHSDIHKVLQQGIAAAKAAHGKQPLPPGASKDALQKRARQILRHVTELDPTNIQAWLWLSTVAEDNNERYFCLETVLVLDPDNRVALTGLDHLHRQAQVTDDDILPEGFAFDTPQESHPSSRYKRIKLHCGDLSPDLAAKSCADESSAASEIYRRLPLLPSARFQNRYHLPPLPSTVGGRLP